VKKLTLQKDVGTSAASCSACSNKIFEWRIWNTYSFDWQWV